MIFFVRVEKCVTTWSWSWCKNISAELWTLFRGWRRLVFLCLKRVCFTEMCVSEMIHTLLFVYLTVNVIKPTKNIISHRWSQTYTHTRCVPSHISIIVHYNRRRTNKNTQNINKTPFTSALPCTLSSNRVSMPVYFVVGN